MKEVQLTQGYVSLVDDEDFERVNKYKWQIYKSKNTNYAKRGYVESRKRKTQYMHNLIVDNNCYSNKTDHIDHNGLNNQKLNLRVCTHFQNMMNRVPNKNTSSKYKGVCWHKTAKKWVSNIYLNKKRIYLGIYDSEIKAAMAYDKKAKELFGEFACLNFL